MFLLFTFLTQCLDASTKTRHLFLHLEQLFLHLVYLVTKMVVLFAELIVLVTKDISIVRNVLTSAFQLLYGVVVDLLLTRPTISLGLSGFAICFPLVGSVIYEPTTSHDD